MNLFDENVEILSKDLLVVKYNELIKYVRYLENKVNEYQKHFNVETLLRQKTPFVGICSTENLDKSIAVEKVIIPQIEFLMYKPYVRSAQEIINQYMNGRR